MLQMLLPSNCYSNRTLPKKKENGSISRRHAEDVALGQKIVAHMILLYIILVQRSQRKQKLPPSCAQIFSELWTK